MTRVAASSRAVVIGATGRVATMPIRATMLAMMRATRTPRATRQFALVVRGATMAMLVPARGQGLRHSCSQYPRGGQTYLRVERESLDE